MMGVTFTPVFNRKGKVNKGGKYTISIRVTIDRKSDYLNPNLPRLEKKIWTGRAGAWVAKDHDSHYLFNGKIQRQLAELNNWADRMVLDNNQITFDKVRNFYGIKGDKTLFNTYVNHYIENFDFDSYRTKQKYLTFQAHLDKFNPSLKFRHLSESLFHDFRDFLKNKLGHKGSTQDKYFDAFKMIVKRAVKDGFLGRNPFDLSDLGIKVNKPGRVSLEEDEIRMFIDANIPKGKPYLERDRDHFVFQCLSGLYYSDMKLLKPGNIQMNREGNMIIKGDRIKGEKPLFIIPLFKLPQAVAILEKNLAREGDYIFQDTLKDQAYNRNLKELAAIVGIDKNISNKVGRHTFTDLMIGMGYPRAFVSKMLGHKKEQTTQIYYDMNARHMGRKLDKYDEVVL